MQSVKCDNCGAIFDRPSAQVKRYKTHFCSTKCMGKYRSKHIRGERASRKSPRVKVSCCNCGKIFDKTPYRISLVSNHYCSHKCRSEYGRIKVACSNCGKPISRHASKDKYIENHYCNRDCFHEWMSKHQTGENNPNFKGGPNYYGPNWRRQRRSARKRDGYRCQSCGVTEKKLGRELDVHHIKPFKSFCCTKENGNYKKANELTNLISLCPTCHKAAEWGSLAIQPKLI